MRVKEGGLVICGRGEDAGKVSRAGGITTPEATRCMTLVAPIKAALK